MEIKHASPAALNPAPTVEDYPTEFSVTQRIETTKYYSMRIRNTFLDEYGDSAIREGLDDGSLTIEVDIFGCGVLLDWSGGVRTGVEVGIVSLDDLDELSEFDVDESPSE